MATKKRLLDYQKATEIVLNELKGKITATTAVMLVSKLKYATVDAVEVVHGRWEQVQRWATKAKYRCSVCGREIMSAVKVNIEKYPYCHCGAKMDGGNEDGST